MLEVDHFASTARGLLLSSGGVSRGSNRISLCGEPVPEGAFAAVEIIETPLDSRINILEIIEPVAGTEDAWQTREVPLEAGLKLIVAVGGRFANRSISGHPPGEASPVGSHLDLLNSGGVAGLSDDPGQPVVKLKVLGGIEHMGRNALLSEFQTLPAVIAPLDDDEAPEMPIVMVMGSDMEVGKTTCAASLALSLRAAGIKITYAKLTGTGRMRDLMRVCYGRPLGYFDSARLGWDFVDTGLATTFPAGTESVRESARILLRHAAARGEIVLAEIADAPFSEGSIGVATDRWINAWLGRSGLIICACENVEATRTVDWIDEHIQLGKEKMLISGRVANDSLGRREVEKKTGVGAISCTSPSDLSHHGLKNAGGAMADWVIRHIMSHRKVFE